MIHKIDYYHIEIPDNLVAAFRALSSLKKAGVNLLACFSSASANAPS
ncbi:MAG: hypothetical protein ACYS0K_24985 [Planctomycetota bacterium]|jgi:hypothetical protein